MSDKNKVLEWLKSGRPITPIEALSELGCYRLGARVFELRQEGHNIVTEMVETTDRNGEKCRFAKYRLVERPKQKSEALKWVAIGEEIARGVHAGLEGTEARFREQLGEEDEDG